MNRKAYLRVAVLCICGLATGLVLGQPLPVRIYGGSNSEQAFALAQGVDPGYCMAGWTRSFGPGTPGKTNVLIVKTDVVGNPQWSIVAGGTDDEEARSIVRTADQCYVAAGWTRSHGPGTPNSNILVLKLTSTGGKAWAWAYGGFQDDEAHSVIETSDRGYAITGRTWSFGPQPHPNIFVAKLSKDGLLQWMRVYWMAPNHIEDEGYSIVETPEGGLAVVGRAKTTGPGFFDPFVLKLDPQGNVQWVSTVPGGMADDEGYSVAVDVQGNILTSGWTRSFGTNPGTKTDIFVAKFSTSGALLVSKTFGWAAGDEKLLGDKALARAALGGSVLCGLTTSVGPGVPNSNFLVLRLDPGCNPMWCRSHPSPYDPGLLTDVAHAIIEEQSGGYAVAGWTNSYSKLGGGDDFHLATLDAQGNRPVCVERQEPEVLGMPWIEWQIEETDCRPEMDSVWVDSVDVKYDSICYDTSGTGLENEAGMKPRSQTASIRVLGSGIELSLSYQAQVRVEVFASDGRQVGLVADGSLAPGRHQLNLDQVSGSGRLAAGAYLVQARVGSEFVAAKVVRY